MKNLGAWHLHDHFSALDGLARPEGYAERAEQIGVTSLAFSNHGTLSGLLAEWKACSKFGIKFIAGVEAYLAPEGVALRETVEWGIDEDRAQPGRYCHMCLYALNPTGLQNLYKMQAESYQNFWFKPRVDIEMLAKYSEGVFATTGCMGSAMSTRIRLGQMDEARLHAEQLKEIYGDNLAAEIMSHGVSGEDNLNKGIIEIASKLKIPLLQTMDAHYVLQADWDNHDSFLAAQTNATKDASKRFRFSGTPSYHLQSYEEMAASGLPEEALRNTLMFAERFESYDSFLTAPSSKLARFDIPKDWDAEEAYIDLMELEV